MFPLRQELVYNQGKAVVLGASFRHLQKCIYADSNVHTLFCSLSGELVGGYFNAFSAQRLYRAVS